jgi:quercetin dioxygenase-like cupin family protein
MYQHFRSGRDLGTVSASPWQAGQALQSNGALTMTPTTSKFSRRIAMAAVVTAALASAGSAQAGGCPADKMRPDGTGEKMNSTPAKDVTDAVLTSVDLAKETAAVKDRLLRLRRLEIKPGGVVPWHEHANRPAIIYIISGEIVEYASTCAVPIVHRAGEVATETHATSHWWKNLGQETVVLLSADFFPTAASDHDMM